MMMKSNNMIIDGLKELVAHAKGESTGVSVSTVARRDIDARLVREGLGLTQVEFSTQFGIKLSTIRQWEQRTRSPRGCARTLLVLIRDHPDLVRQAVKNEWL